MQKESRGDAAVLPVHKGQSDCQRLDQLLSPGKYEDIHERVWEVAPSQDTSSHYEAVEKTANNLQKSDDSESSAENEVHTRADSADSQLQTRFIQDSRDDNGPMSRFRTKRIEILQPQVS